MNARDLAGPDLFEWDMPEKRVNLYVCPGRTSDKTMFSPMTLIVGAVGLVLAVVPVVILATAYGSIVAAVIGLASSVILYVSYLSHLFYKYHQPGIPVNESTFDS